MLPVLVPRNVPPVLLAVPHPAMGRLLARLVHLALIRSRKDKRIVVFAPQTCSNPVWDHNHARLALLDCIWHLLRPTHLRQTVWHAKRERSSFHPVIMAVAQIVRSGITVPQVPLHAPSAIPARLPTHQRLLPVPLANCARIKTLLDKRIVVSVRLDRINRPLEPRRA